MPKLTKARFSSALTAYYLAIKEKIETPRPMESILDLANQYGRSITNKDDLGLIEECFDWDKILELLEEVHSA